MIMCHILFQLLERKKPRLLSASRTGGNPARVGWSDEESQGLVTSGAGGNPARVGWSDEESQGLVSIWGRRESSKNWMEFSRTSTLLKSGCYRHYHRVDMATMLKKIMNLTLPVYIAAVWCLASQLAFTILYMAIQFS